MKEIKYLMTSDELHLVGVTYPCRIEYEIIPAPREAVGKDFKFLDAVEYRDRQIKNLTAQRDALMKELELIMPAEQRAQLLEIREWAAAFGLSISENAMKELVRRITQ
jgi:hypothetical protein